MNKLLYGTPYAGPAHVYDMVMKRFIGRISRMHIATRRGATKPNSTQLICVARHVFGFTLDSRAF